jgi:hypothetical protein
LLLLDEVVEELLLLVDDLLLMVEDSIDLVVLKQKSIVFI